MNRRDFLRMSIVAGAAARGWAADTKPTPPNILWVLFDDARPDVLGCYGRPWANTPNMDAVAARGVRFETAVVQCPICVPSRTSYKTGQYAHQTGIMSMGDPPETRPPYGRPRTPQYADLLTAWTDAGRKPINVGKIHAFRPHWDHRGDPRQAKPPRKIDGKQYDPVNLTTHGWQIGGTIPVHPDDTRTSRIADRALDVVEQLAEAGGPFFLRVSFHAPHVPIQVPPPFMVDPESVTLPYPTQEELDSKPRFEREQLRIYAGTTDLSREAIQVARGTYYGMIALADHGVGRLLDRMRERGLLDNTIVAINSDHGLQMGEHGLHKKRNFYEQTVCIPMVFSWPGHLPEGEVVREPVEFLDFLPTLMDLSGMTPPRDVAGRSMAPLMRGDTTTARHATFSEIDQSGSMYDELRRDSGRRVMVRTKDWKLIYFRDPRVKDKDGALYNLEKDPGETQNLYNDPAYAETIARLEALVDDWDRVGKEV